MGQLLLHLLTCRGLKHTSKEAVSETVCSCTVRHYTAVVESIEATDVKLGPREPLSCLS